MALILYPSGILKNFKSNNLMFSDKEILDIFKNFNKIRTKRLFEVPNTWIVWANAMTSDEDSFSNIGSSIIEEDVFSPILFIHDTEMDPSWLLSDDPILYPYEIFDQDLKQFVDDVARSIIEENIQESDNKKMIMLTTVGSTSDNRVLFDLYTENQSEEFYKINFGEFAKKTIQFLLDKQDKAFGDLGVIVFEDKKIVIRVRHDDFDFLLTKLNEYSEKYEEYEWCIFIKYFKEVWEKHVNNVKK